MEKRSQVLSAPDTRAAATAVAALAAVTPPDPSRQYVPPAPLAAAQPNESLSLRPVSRRLEGSDTLPDVSIVDAANEALRQVWGGGFGLCALAWCVCARAVCVRARGVCVCACVCVCVRACVRALGRGALKP